MEKKIKFFVLCLILVATIASCSKAENITEVSSITEALTDKTTKAKGNQISIYIPQNSHLITSVINDFNSKNKNHSIVASEFDSWTKEEETRTKITTALMAGEGPDIIFEYNALFPSLKKMFESGAFCDLNNLIEKDTEFKLSDYNQTVLDSGIVNGKRYVLPISYRIPSLWTTKNILDKNGIHIDASKWTWKDFFTEAKKFTNKHNKENKYFIGNYFEPQYIMGDICSELVDYENKKTKFTSSEFIDFLKNYKAISASICSSDQLRKQDEIINCLESNSIIITSTEGYIDPYDVYALNSVLKQELGEEVFLLNNPSLDNRLLKSAYPVEMLGINSNCKSKEKAFEFIKLLLSEENQSGELPSIPVNIKGYTNVVDSYTAIGMRGDRVGYFLSNVNAESVPLPAQVAKNMDEVISNINTCNIADPRIAEIASAEVTEYLKSNRSAEDTAKIIDEKVMLYLNE